MCDWWVKFLNLNITICTTSSANTNRKKKKKKVSFFIAPRLELKKKKKKKVKQSPHGARVKDVHYLTTLQSALSAASSNNAIIPDQPVLHG